MMRMKKWRTKLRLNTYDGTMPHSSPNEVSDSDGTNTEALLSAVWAVDATTIRKCALTPDAFAEQDSQVYGGVQSDSDATNTEAPLAAVWAVDATIIRESALTPNAFAEQGRQTRFGMLLISKCIVSLH